MQTVWEGKKLPALQVARKKNLADQKSPIPPSRVKWSAPKATGLDIISTGIFPEEWSARVSSLYKNSVKCIDPTIYPPISVLNRSCG